LADVFADQLANICNALIVKLGQGLSFFKPLHIMQRGCTLVNQVVLFSRVSEFDAIVLDEVAGCRIKWVSFLCHSSRRVKWVG
jgi:hypothetical protein